jgi:hypothetical protein
MKLYIIIINYKIINYYKFYNNNISYYKIYYKILIYYKKLYKLDKNLI